MTKQMMCTFCRNKGIIPPHDHTIRDFTKKGSPIMCPELLTLQCKYCKEKGHTVNYCKILKEKKINKSSPLSIINTKKHSLITHSDGFIELKKININKISINSENTVTQNIKKIQKVNTLSSIFGALDVQDNNTDKEVQDISNSRKINERIAINKTICWGDSDEEDMFCN
tara:strand:+ start:102 stop:611 length:510 start_codon:yes stop_codon:yes gene_type:complete